MNHRPDPELPTPEHLPNEPWFDHGLASSTPRAMLTGDLRLTRLLCRPERPLATINEYAAATGIELGTVLDLIGPLLDAGTVDIEAVGGEIFLHTAPKGRPGADLPANLWEQLRRRNDTSRAYAVWRLIRDLEAAGWRCEADPSRIPAAVDGQTTPVALVLNGGLVPLLVRPSLDHVGEPSGVLTWFERANLTGVALTCPPGTLETYTTAARRWILTRPVRTQLHILILEEPRYQPVLLSPDDGAVAPRSTSIDELDATTP